MYNRRLSTVTGLLVLLAFTCKPSWALSGRRGLHTLNSGSSLSVEEETNILISPNGSFSSGFYKVGANAFCYSIWFTNTINKTVVWMANRDRPVNGKYSKLTFQGDGNLILRDADGTPVWKSDASSQTAVKAQLLETGNLVLINQAGEIVWESFNSPTDTLLPTQLLTRAKTLVSMRGQSTYLSGYYNLHFRDDNILSLVYNGPQVSSVYWPNPYETVFISKRTPYNSSKVAVLNKMGRFRSSDNLKFNASDFGVGPKRRLTLDYDGNLRLYSLDESTGLWETSWSTDIEPCKVHGLCGVNGICSYAPSPTCTCPPGFNMIDPSDWSRGCSTDLNLTCDPVESNFAQLYNTDYYGYDLSSYGTNMTFQACRNACVSDCRCRGFGYPLNGLGECFPKSILLNGYQTPNSAINMYIKVPKNGINGGGGFMKLNPFDLNCSGTDIVFIYGEAGDETEKHLYMKYLIAFLVAVGVVEVVFIFLGWWCINQRHGSMEVIDMGYLTLAMGFRHFNYAELKMATRNFREVIGKGGFGTVYKGVLDDDRIVAVKRLEGVVQGETEFWAEVRIIGRINHMNLVRILGFCAEGKHRLLVYEYLENGSLDKILFSASPDRLDWDRRFDIALGTAKGLSYIHEECLEWVLHCDVKPQNILLDENFHPKVADFGMSKFVEKNGLLSSFSRVRGTRGYLAPEWMVGLQITAKADVYSYGIVLLELLSGRRSSDVKLAVCQRNECNYLVQWVREKAKKREGIMEAVDPRLNGEYNIKEVRKLVRVALLCVAEDKDRRPAMSEVVELLYNDKE